MFTENNEPIKDITPEIAEVEITKWLDKKKVYQSVREANKANIKILVEALTRGDLVHLPETNGFKHRLLHPIESEKKTTELEYAGRLNDITLSKYMKGVDSDDGDERLIAILSALTGGTPKGLIRALDSLDKKIAMAIAVFFI
jgi:hypothetical protein